MTYEHGEMKKNQELTRAKTINIRRQDVKDHARIRSIKPERDRRTTRYRGSGHTHAKEVYHAGETIAACASFAEICQSITGEYLETSHKMYKGQK